MATEPERNLPENDESGCERDSADENVASEKKPVSRSTGAPEIADSVADDASQVTRAEKAPVTCPCCKELYREPKLLPCLHVVCSSCLKRIATSVTGKATGGVQVTCPQCNKDLVLSDKTSLSRVELLCPESLVTKDLVSRHRLIEKQTSSCEKADTRDGQIVSQCDQCPESVAVAYCRTCAMFCCALCQEAHQRWPELATHQVVALDSLQLAADSTISTKVIDVICPKHSGESLKIFCSDCQELICHDCTLIQHRSHKYDFVGAQLLMEHRDKMQDVLGSLSDLLKTLAQFASNAEKEQKSLGLQVSESKVQVENEFAQIEEAVTTRKNNLLAQLDSVASDPAAQLQQHCTYIKSLQRQIFDCHQFMSNGLQHCSSIAILSVERSVCQRITEIKQEVQGLKPHQSEFRVNFTCNKELVQHIGSIGQVSSHRCSTTKASHTPLERSESSPDVLSHRGSWVTVKPGSPLRSNMSEVSLPESESSDTDPVSIIDDLVFCQPTPKFLGIPVRAIENVERPHGIAVRNSIFVCEFKSHQIAVIDMLGVRNRQIGSMGDRRGQFLLPYSLAYIDNDRMLVTDSMYRIQMFASNGRHTKSVGRKGTKALEFKNPAGIAVGQNRKIYVCDKENHRVQVLNEDLTFNSIIGKRGSGPVAFNFPSDVACDVHGNVYIADSWNHRIQVLTEDGSFLHQFGQKGAGQGQLNMPSHLCVDPDGYVFVTEMRNHRVSVFRSCGNFVMSFGSKGNKFNQLLEPRGVAIDANKMIYVSDFGNNRVMVFK